MKMAWLNDLIVLMYNNNYMNMFRKIFVGTLIAATFSMFTPNLVDAQVPPCPSEIYCFGGKSSAAMTVCTCSYYYWSVFAPIYFYGMTEGSAMAAPMAFPPAVLYAEWLTGPMQWFVGEYQPYNACYMYAVYGCYELPSYGTVDFMKTGVSPTNPN
jgi:hypothetical protein